MRVELFLSGIAALGALQVTPDPAIELMEADRAFCEATTAHGVDGWLDWFTSDACVATAAGELKTGIEQLDAYYRSIDFPPPGFCWEPQTARLAESGELGYSLGTWEIRAPDASAPRAALLSGGTYLSVWRREPDGVLRVVADLGGRTDFRTRLEEAAGLPLEWSSSTERHAVAKSGELAYALGTWTAGTAASEHRGRFLTVWQRESDEVWKIAAEIGFDY